MPKEVAFVFFDLLKQYKDSQRELGIDEEVINEMEKSFIKRFNYSMDNLLGAENSKL